MRHPTALLSALLLAGPPMIAAAAPLHAEPVNLLSLAGSSRLLAFFHTKSGIPPFIFCAGVSSPECVSVGALIFHCIDAMPFCTLNNVAFCRRWRGTVRVI